MTNETQHEITVSKTPHSEITGVRLPSLAAPFEEAERLFDRLMSRNWIRPMAWNWPLWGLQTEALETRIPQMDVIDRDQDILVRVEMPGVEKKDVAVSIGDNNTLNITGRSQRETTEHREDYFRCEISQGNFSRSLSLPKGIDASKASATLKDGILEVVLQKEESVQRRPIEVK